MQGLDLTTAVDKARATEAVTKEADNFIEDGRNMELDNTARLSVRKVAPRHKMSLLWKMPQSQTPCKIDTGKARRKLRNVHTLEADSRNDDSYSEEESGQEYHCIHKLQQSHKQRCKRY